jgi:hypothetical protein
MAAYVEIVFDNSDGESMAALGRLHSLTRILSFLGRFSVESDEVVLRRTIG